MRPAKEQFQIYWDKKSKRYEPDFVVEGQHAIYLIETKKKADIPSEEVQEKAKAALHFCSHATKFNLEHGKKPWKYVIIPHDQVLAQMTFAFLVEKHEYLQK